MDSEDRIRALLRVERGRADEHELAALALVLCSLLAVRVREERPEERAAERSTVSWPDLEGAPVYRAPQSWR